VDDYKFCSSRAVLWIVTLERNELQFRTLLSESYGADSLGCEKSQHRKNGDARFSTSQDGLGEFYD
jgi:hypothetical protein